MLKTILQPGNEYRFYCSPCMIEFAIVLEPKLTEMSRDEALLNRQQMESKNIGFCPFCGKERIQES